MVFTTEPFKCKVCPFVSAKLWRSKTRIAPLFCITREQSTLSKQPELVVSGRLASLRKRHRQI